MTPFLPLPKNQHSSSLALRPRKPPLTSPHNGPEPRVVTNREHPADAIGRASQIGGPFKGPAYRHYRLVRRSPQHEEQFPSKPVLPILIFSISLPNSLTSVEFIDLENSIALSEEEKSLSTSKMLRPEPPIKIDEFYFHANKSSN